MSEQHLTGKAARDSATAPDRTASGCCGTGPAAEQPAAQPCCGTAAQAQESGACCGAEAKAGAVAVGAGCC
jgi:hypothetical protein